MFAKLLVNTCINMSNKSYNWLYGHGVLEHYQCVQTVWARVAANTFQTYVCVLEGLVKNF